jgi:dihydroorotase
MITCTPTAPSLLLKNIHLIDPTQNWNGPAELLVEEGRVSLVGRSGELEARAAKKGAPVRDGKKALCAPGFIDLNCTIPDPGQEGIESVSSGSLAAAAGGFTSVLSRPATDPVNDNAFVTDLIRRRAASHSVVRLLPQGALTHGRQGKRLAELGCMAAAGVYGYGDGIAIPDSYLMRKALEYARAFDRPVISFPEDSSLSASGLMQEGWNSNRLGLRGIPAAAEEIGVCRDLALARHTGGRLHLQPLSTVMALRALRAAKAAGLRVTADTCPIYFTLTSDAIATYDTNLKCFPPLRTEEDCAAVLEAIVDGTIDAIASGHLPQPLSAKAQSFEAAAPGQVGLETAFLLSLVLVERKLISPLRLIELFSAGPAKILGVENEVGSLRPGSRADFVLFDPRATTKLERLHSNSKNTPFLGQQLQGKILSTFVGGTLVYES